jgi:tripartite-type tricarboxylate transporter receptor subunit TctC
MTGHAVAKRALVLMISLGLAAGAWALPAGAQEVYPSKSITVIVPFSAGGSTDIAFRGIAPYIEKYLKTSIVVENVPGADGIIGYSRGYSAKPDGYTLTAVNTLPLLLAELSRDTKYKSDEFKPIYAFATGSMILVVYPEFCKDFGEFVKIGRSQTIKVGTTGAATTTGLMGILLEEELGLKVNWIPYGGGSESLASLAGKHIDAVFSMTASAQSLSKAGKIRPLAVFSEKRNPKYPDVPVPKELGTDIPLLNNLTGIVGPPGLPDDKVATVAAAAAKAVQDPGYLEWLNKAATTELTPMDPQEFKKEFERLSALTQKYKKYLKQQ